MGGTDKDRHRPWLAFALEESLGRSLFSARDVIVHANPEVLVAQLPLPVISELFSRALAAGTFTATQVIETAPPALLAEHLEPDVMWRCLKDVADRNGVSKKGAARSAPTRQWFANVLERALDTDLVSPADVLRFLPPADFVGEAPRSVMAQLIKTALVQGTLDAALVLDHITPAVIAENIELSAVWSCISEAATRHFELSAAKGEAKGNEAKGNEPATAPAATPAAAAPAPSAATPAKPIYKPIDREKPTIEKRAISLAEKAAALAPGVVPLPGIVRPTAASQPAAPRAEVAPARAPVAAAPAAQHDTNEWRPADDLDVLEDQPL